MKKIILSVLIFFSLFLQLHSQIIVENSHFRYEVGEDGKNLHFKDKLTGTDHLYADTISHCAHVVFEGKRYDADHVSREGDQLLLRFGKSGVTTNIRLVCSGNFITFRMIKVTGAPTSVTFLNIPLNLEGTLSEHFAACVLSMNLQTQVKQLPALQTHLCATAYQRFGIVGSEANLIGVPQKEILPVIRTIMKQAKELPFSDRGGAWASLGEEGYGSYLMQFGNLTEKTVEEWIDLCKQLGFNQIDNHGGGNFFSFGELELNREKWPDGWQSFKRINDKLHKQGISSILHTYSFFIDKNCRYVTPIPSKELGYFRTFTLAKPIGPEEKVIEVNESTAGMSTIVGFFEQNSISLRIGDEIIEFEGVSATPPYLFTGCKRGVLGTKASAHQATDTLYHLREQYGRFVPDPNSSLFTEIAKKTADIVDECGFDGIYFDAIDGCRVLADREDSWYYGTKFLLEVAHHLKKPVGMEMSDMFHHWWHYRSRWLAWDTPKRGYKRFIDLHTDAVKGGNPNRFDLEHAEEIKQRSLHEKGGLYLPLHLGWFSLETGIPQQTEPTFPDEVEYLCCKMLGNNASLSIICGDEVRKMKKNPAFQRLSGIIRQYEILRHQKYFNDTVLAKLREPGKEFTLIREGKKWNLKPVMYSKQTITGVNDPTAKWKVTNSFEVQPMKLRIELLMSVKPYEDPDQIVLSDFRNGSIFKERSSAEGVASTMVSYNDPRFNDPTFQWSAYNLGAKSLHSSWTKAAQPFKHIMDLSGHQALGFWIKGDGKGELLNVRRLSPQHLSFGARDDHLIPIDFTGWKYVELVENDGANAYLYEWDSSGEKNCYSFFREQLNFKYINGLQLAYNRLPNGDAIHCQLSQIKALPLVSNTIENPTITIGKESVIFPVTMESGMYLELENNGSCTLYSSKGDVLKKVKPKGEIPMLNVGENKFSFTCDETMAVRCRVRVTIATYGNPLKKEE